MDNDLTLYYRDPNIHAREGTSKHLFLLGDIPPLEDDSVAITGGAMWGPRHSLWEHYSHHLVREGGDMVTSATGRPW